MQTLTTLDKLSLFDTNKSERAEFVNAIIEGLDNGMVDPLKIHLQIKSMEDIICQLTVLDEKKNKNFLAAKKYRLLLLEAAQKYSTKSFEVFNGKFEIKETGTKYDYSQCGDLVYNGLSLQMKELEIKLKAREDFLKTIDSKGLIITDESTGETVTIYPPSKKSTTSVSVSLK